MFCKLIIKRERLILIKEIKTVKIGLSIVFLIFFIQGILCSSHSGILEGVLRPSVIDVEGNLLFVMDIEKMHIFSLDTLKHLKTFGKKGEGPGEYPVFSGTSNKIRAYSGSLMHEALNKIIFFDHEGKLLRETKKPALIKNIHSLEDKFVGRRIYQPQDRSTAFSVVCIYDRDMKMEKEIARQEFFQQGTGGNLTYDLSYDTLIFDVAGEHIFVERSRKGPFIEVFDKKGTKLYSFPIPRKKISLRKNDRKMLLNYFIQDSRIQQIMRQNRIGWKELSKNFKFSYPDYYPSVCDMFIDDAKIYIKTWLRDQNGESEYLIMDLKGNLIKRCFIPPLIPFKIRSIGSGKLETIQKGQIYYLTENDEGNWFFNMWKIKM